MNIEERLEALKEINAKTDKKREIVNEIAKACCEYGNRTTDIVNHRTYSIQVEVKVDNASYDVIVGWRDGCDYNGMLMASPLSITPCYALSEMTLLELDEVMKKVYEYVKSHQ